VGCSTKRTFDPSDAKPVGFISVFNSPVIIPMNFQTGRMTAGARKPVELNGGKQVIVKNLRNRIAKVSR